MRVAAIVPKTDISAQTDNIVFKGLNAAPFFCRGIGRPNQKIHTGYVLCIEYPLWVRSTGRWIDETDEICICIIGIILSPHDADWKFINCSFQFLILISRRTFVTFITWQNLPIKSRIWFALFVYPNDYSCYTTWHSYEEY